MALLLLRPNRRWGSCFYLVLSRIKNLKYFFRREKMKTYDNQTIRQVSLSQSPYPQNFLVTLTILIPRDVYSDRIHNDTCKKWEWWLLLQCARIYTVQSQCHAGRHSSSHGSWLVKAYPGDHFRTSGLNQSASGAAWLGHVTCHLFASFSWRKEHFSWLKLVHLCPHCM